MTVLGLVRKELLLYFSSFLFYALTAVFLALCGFLFYTNLDFYVRFGGMNQVRGLWQYQLFDMRERFLVLVPLLTMRLFAEERRVGTLEMLLTAPVGEVEVVLAKFGAGLAFYLAMWVPSLLYLAIVKSYGAIPDVGPIATSYLGIVLVGALFTAAGLFASSLTSTQVLAAVLATVFNLLLLLVPVLSQYVVRVESLERFFVELAIWRHFADSFAKGIVDTAHVAFYVLISVVFLFWTTRSLESQRWR